MTVVDRWTTAGNRVKWCAGRPGVYDEAGMRPLWVPFVAMVPICTLVVLAANALGIEPYGLGFIALLLVGMLLTSAVDPVRFGWREPEEPERSG